MGEGQVSALLCIQLYSGIFDTNRSKLLLLLLLCSFADSAISIFNLLELSRSRFRTSKANHPWGVPLSADNWDELAPQFRCASPTILCVSCHCLNSAMLGDHVFGMILMRHILLSGSRIFSSIVIPSRNDLYEISHRRLKTL